MIVVTLAVGLLGSILLLPTLSDCSSLLKALFSRTRQPGGSRNELPRFLVLVPAHNEEMMVGACIQSLQAMRYPSERCTVYVIADNCDDRTADLARAAGAECLERTDTVRRGKPHAIAWALEQLPLEDVDAVIIVDADTVVAADFAAALARNAPLQGKAVQAYCDVDNHTDNALTRLAAILAAANHRFAYPLKQRAGLNTPLLGNGMCIGTHVLRTHGWLAFSLSEDWEMYATLTARGISIECAPDAVVYAQEARTLDQSLSQRERWTAGRLMVLAHTAVPLLRSGRVGPRQKLDVLAELSSPGPVVHGTLALLGIGLVGLLGLPRVILLAFVASILRLLVYAMLGVRVQRDRADALAALAFLPVYALWRVGAVLSALRMLGDKPWVRTGRHPRSHAVNR